MIRADPVAASLGALIVSTAVHAAVLLLPVGSSVSRTSAASADPPEIAIEAPDVPATPESPVAAVTPPAAAAPHERMPASDRPVAREASPLSAPAAAVETTDDAMPRFTIAIGSTPDADGALPSSGSAAAHGREEDGQPVAEGLVDGKARLVYGLSPSYPAAARMGGVEGDVRLELVVGVAGAVESARVVQGIDSALDAAALEAAKRFRFAPATKSGRAVRVRMQWSIEYRLR